MYAGDLESKAQRALLSGAGWLVCDGASARRDDYPDLFRAIGTANGGTGDSFALPDLRDRFMRGAFGGAARIDPDASSRVAAQPGGATEDDAGSLQAAATALPLLYPWTLAPSSDHTHTYQHLNTDMHQAWNGSTYTMARWSGTAVSDPDGSHSHALTGFDAATAPVSMALNFIIRAEIVDNGGRLPAATIAGFAGALPQIPSGWLDCDGTAYAVPTFPDLFDALFDSFGGDGSTVFNVPDLRGYFLRGTSQRTGQDPDADQRHALTAGGNAGDSVGSAQSTATRAPAALAIAVAGDHSHNISLVPQEDHHAAKGASGPLAKNTMAWTDDRRTTSPGGVHTHTILGGDRESRPVNISARFLLTSAALDRASTPIGSIVSFGGDTTDPGVVSSLSRIGWIACNGGLLRISEFEALYEVVGTTYGMAPLKFGIPDLRGLFVQGAATRAVGGKSTSSSTGAPVNPFVTSTDGLHTHTVDGVPTDTHTIDVVLGWDLAANNGNKSPSSVNGAHTHTITGGDHETRPVNVDVNYIIRFE